MTLSITTLSVMAFTVTPSIRLPRRYAECRIFIVLNGIMLRVSVQSIMMLNVSMIGIIMRSGIMLNVIMPCVVMLSIIMLNAVC